MSERVCPWWLGHLLASPLRRLLHDPGKVVTPYIRPGMTVLEPGPGMGFFTTELARQVGPSGRVIAVDVQPRMIAGLKRRIAKAGLADRVDARVALKDSLELTDATGKVDFTLAFAMVHEMRDSARFFAEAAQASKPGAQLLLAEPSGHVSQEKFDKELQEAAQAGFAVVERPTIRHSQAALLKKS
jgi:tRNA A58 N-methylase Trm61